MRALALPFAFVALSVANSLSVAAAECLTLVCDNNSTISVTGGAAPAVEVTSTAGRESSTRSSTVSGWVGSCVGEVVSGEGALGLLSGRAVPFGPADLAAGFDPDGAWGLVRCPDHPNVGVAGDVYALYEVTSPPQRVIDLVVARAYGETELPTLAASSAPSGSTDQPLITGLSSWLWLDGWRSASASASLPGLTATVTATPASEVTWRLEAGDHIEVVGCNGPGNATSAACQLTPVVRGDGALTAQVRWAYSVACTSTCVIALPGEVVEVSTPVQVAEVRGVIVR